MNGWIPRVEAAAGADCEIWTRQTAIARLREALLALSDGEHSMCSVAAELGVFCRGFRQWNDDEFLRRWTRIIGQSSHLTRAQMERLADLWQLCEQVRTGARIACDLAGPGTTACRGWSGFSNAYLERCCDELLGRNVVVVETNKIAQKDHGDARHSVALQGLREAAMGAGIGTRVEEK